MVTSRLSMMVKGRLSTRARQARPFALVLPAVPDSIPKVRAVAVACARRNGLRGEELEGVRLAVSEAVTNVVRHAYRGLNGDIWTTMSPSRDEFVVVVEDDGCGPDTPPVAPGLGWGCPLMERVCDGFALERRSQGGTRVRLRFRRR
jgi:anti-sigma regulatory factor (Ser/Thr protein kinase)